MPVPAVIAVTAAARAAAALAAKTLAKNAAKTKVISTGKADCCNAIYSKSFYKEEVKLESK